MKKRANKLKITLLLSFTLMIIILIYIVINSTLFNSKIINIEGNDLVQTNDIIQNLDIKTNKNIFTYNIKNMENELLENHCIENVKIVRKLPNKLDIMIIEKEIAATINDGENYYYIDYNGDFIKEVSDSDKDKKIISLDIEYSIDSNKDIVFKNDNDKKQVLSLLKDIKKYELCEIINKISFKSSNIINMYAEDDIEIIMPNNKEIDYNIRMLKAILEDLYSQNIKMGIIDFTISDNPIYKSK